MKTFIIEFNERCKEVHEYLLFLEFIDSIATNKHNPLENEANDGSRISYLLTRETQKILRANFYLLLYNLIEATTNSIITVVKDTVNDEGVTLDRLETRLVYLHIEGLYKEVTSSTRIVEISKKLYRNAAKNEIVLFDKLGFNTSGNVDYDFFQKIVGTIGCRGALSIDERVVKDAMKRTKEHRNKLAHGNWSFSSAGTCLTLSQIKIDHYNVVAFLSQSLNNFEIYLDKKKYLKSKHSIGKYSN